MNLQEYLAKYRSKYPKKDGGYEHITYLSIPYSGVTTLDGISELFPNLVELDISCTPHVYDLSPLEGMWLKKLNCCITGVSCLTPLASMPLEELYCFDTAVDDLAPLKDCPLKVLDCSNTGVVDLFPLRGMQLKNLDCSRTGVKDLSPLKGLPLMELDCSSTSVNKQLVAEQFKHVERLYY